MSDVNVGTRGFKSDNPTGLVDSQGNIISYKTLANTILGTGVIPTNGSSGSSSSGAITKVATLTAATSASLDLTSLGSYNHWQLVGRFLIPDTAGAIPKILFGTGGGPTWAATNYDYAGEYTADSGFNALQAGSAGVAFIQLFPSSQNATPGISFSLEVWTDHSTYVELAGFVRILNNDGKFYTVYTGGGWHMSADITGIRFIMSAGNITSGKLSLYGVTE